MCVPRAVKEAEFFDRYYERGIDWYLELFRACSAPAAGEFTGTYLHSDAALDRIARHFPHVRCIVSLRDPVARLDSEYRDAIRLVGYPGDRQAFIARYPKVVERGRYSERLTMLLDRFPLKQVKVFILEDLAADPRSAARDLYQFVGVDRNFVPGTLQDRVNPSRSSALPAVDRLAHSLYRFSAERDLAWLMRLGRSGPVRRLRSLVARPQAAGASAMAPSLARDLRKEYAEDIEATGRILGRDLTALWRMGAP